MDSNQEDFEQESRGPARISIDFNRSDRIKGRGRQSANIKLVDTVFNPQRDFWLKIEIPKPKAKRMARNPKVIEIHYSGFDGGHIEKYPVPASEFLCFLPMNKNLEDAAHSDRMDGGTYRVSVVYYNDNKSRVEVVKPKTSVWDGKSDEA